jgi:hypothetical protein
MHLLYIKRFMKEYLCWYAHEEPFVPHKTMIERMVRSTSSVSSVYRVVDDNNNPYKNMVMDAMIMNQGHTGHYPIVDEELNANATKFFYFLKDSDKLLNDGCTNHSTLSAVAQVFIIKLDHRLSEASYDRIVE